jgi:flagellar basal-body rod protein FlgG
MLDALYISAVGLQAQKEQLDAIANNLANLSTTAFKRQSVDFAAILDRPPAGAANNGDPVSAADAATLRRLRADMTAGAVHATGRLLDIAIDGAGFLEVELPDGRSGYSRAGALRVNAEGVLSLAGGQPLKADVRIPTGASDVAVLGDGSVIATVPGDVTATVLGQIELATFANPESLEYRGDAIFTAPESAPEPTRSRPGEEGTRPLIVQSLEGSNVDMTQEIVSLTLVQRIYELNSRVAQTADELMGMANNMRRS